MRNRPLRTFGKWLTNLWNGGSGRISKFTDDPNFQSEDLFADFVDVFSSFEHKELLKASRTIFNMFPEVTGAVKDIAVNVVGDKWNPQYSGLFRDFGRAAEEFLKNYSPVVDVRGFPYGLIENRYLLTLTLLRDGEYFILKTRYRNGSPALQYLESHRFGNRNRPDGEIKGGKYDGAILKNGIAYNSYGRPLAYHFLADNPQNDQFIPASSIIHVFDPVYLSQGRGFSPLVVGIIDWMAAGNWKANESLAQVLATTLVFKEKNQTGTVNPAQAIFSSVGDKPRGSGGTQNQFFKSFTKGGTRFLRLGKEDVEVFDTGNRPSADSRSFHATLLRSALLALGWTFEQAYDSKGLAGPAIRRDIEKNQKTVRRLQKVESKGYRREIIHLISYADKLKLITDEVGEPIPLPVDWFKWEPELPRKMSIDLGRDAKSDELLMKAGLANEFDFFRDNGSDYEGHLTKRITAFKLRQQMAEEHDLTPEQYKEVFGTFDPNPEAAKAAAGKSESKEGNHE